MRNPIPMLAVVSLSCALLLSACGGEAPEAMLVSAKGFIAKKDNKAAAIQIKNALQKNPNLPEARFLLGKILLESGDTVAAELELRKALELRHPNDQVIPLLVRAHLILGQFDKVIDEVPKAVIASAEGRAELKSSLAIAYFSQGKRDKAGEAIAAALADKPDHPDALLIRARLKAALPDLDGALGDVGVVTEKFPGNYNAQKLKGDLLVARDQLEPAIAAYRKAIEAKGDLVPAHAALVALYLQAGKMDEAVAQLAEMKKAAPGNLQTLFNEGLLAFVKRDFKGAREKSQQLLQKAGNNVLALQLAGAVEFNLGAYVQAEDYLLKAVKLAPELVTSRRWLAMTYLSTGQPAKAAGVLAPMLSKIDDDSSMTALAGEVYMQLGDFKKGEEYLLKASKLDPKNPGKRTSLALARLVKGDTDSAFSDLAQVSAADPGTVADLALLAAHMRRGDYEKALKAVDVIEKKKPNDVQTHDLRGRVLVAKGDVAGARKSFEQALSVNPAYFPAAASLASLDLAENKMEAAQKRFENLITSDARNSAAILALADLKIRARASSEEVLALLNKAISAAPSEPAARLGLVLYYLTIGDPKKGISAAQDASAAIPDNPDILDVLGRAQLAGGESNQALATYAKLAAAQPGSALPYIRMADAHMAAKNLDAAAQSLRKALEIRPDSVAAQRTKATLDLNAGKPQDALNIAREIQKQKPGDAVGFVLEGDIDASRNAWASAASAYRTGLKQVPSSGELAFKLYSALFADGKRAEAEKFAASFIKDNPKDAGFLFSLGDFANARGDFNSALARYLPLLEMLPENAALLNNMAWAMGRLKQPGAINYAEKANTLAPNQPAFMDTLGVLLAEKGDFARATEVLGKAVAAAPQQAGIRLNFARVLVNAGRKADAKRELDVLAKLGDQFPLQGEVARMQKEL